MPLRRQATRRFLATVLFTDIVGSTERAAELGDRAWRDLLERHHAVVRRELRAFHGREIGTAGDGFFALFEAPERAVRCAESIVAAVGSLGLQVRAGVHTGECEVIGGEVGGMAVHIGSRVAALAGPGEVLVTGQRPGPDDRLGPALRGRRAPGAQGGRRPVAGVPAGPGRGQRRGGRLPAAVDGAAVHPPAAPAAGRRGSRPSLVVALAVTGVYLLTRSDAEVVVGENAVGVIGPGDAAAGQRGGRGRAAPDRASPSGTGSVWVTNSAADSVSRIDRDSDVSVPINLAPGPPRPGWRSARARCGWRTPATATVSRIDPATSRV